MEFKRLIGGLTACVIAVAPIAANAECFTDSEWKAAHVRILQTELQVAALECANVSGASYNDKYSAFITRFHDRLKANATALKAHFLRLFGRDSDRQLDIFVTRIANDASGRTMKDMKFCANSGPAFDAALSLDTTQFEIAAVDHVTDHSEVGELCPAKSTAPKVVVATTQPKQPVAVANAVAPTTPASP